MEVTNYLLGYKNLHIVQNTQMFNFSLDSVLLPKFISINKNINKILDIGCGNAPIPLIMSTMTSAEIIGVEIQKEIYDLAIKSVKLNKLENKISILNRDINELVFELETDSFDIITCNPPFFKVDDKSIFNQNEQLTIARHEVKLNIDQVLKISKKLLKNNGVLGIVHRPERLTDILMSMRENNIEPKKIQYVYPRKDKDAKVLLIEGRKNGKPGLKVLPPLFVHKKDGSYTKVIIKKYFEDK